LFFTHLTGALTKFHIPYIAMINPTIIESITQSLIDHLPNDLASIKSETEKNFRSILQQQFAKLDLVTREEFDVQSAVLARTREKLDALEQTLNELTENNNT